MANDIKLGNSHPITENIYPITVGGEVTSVEIAKTGNGAKVTGDLEVNGVISGKYNSISIDTGDVDSMNHYPRLNIGTETASSLTWPRTAMLNIKGEEKVRLSGTVTATNGSTALVGSGTAFLSELSHGCALRISNLEDTFTQINCITVIGNIGVTHPTNANILAGMSVSGTGIPAGAEITEKLNDYSFLMNVEATASATSTLTFIKQGGVESGGFMENAVVSVTDDENLVLTNAFTGETGSQKVIYGDPEYINVTSGALSGAAGLRMTLDRKGFLSLYGGTSGERESYFRIAPGILGSAIISTVDESGTDADLTLDVDGDITLDAVGGDVNILQADLNIPTTKKLYLDGGGDTYIHETSADIVQLIVGGDIMAEMTESGDNGSRFHFRSACAGFTKIVETFSDDSIIVSGETNDTHIDFRFSNKISLAVTGNITNLNLIFPPVSGNFLLLLTYTGDYSITNWKVYEHDESAADGDADVLWPGGTKPDNTASGVDVFSFFYDATSGADKCYGVASLAFATP